MSSSPSQRAAPATAHIQHNKARSNKCGVFGLHQPVIQPSAHAISADEQRLRPAHARQGIDIAARVV